MSVAVNNKTNSGIYIKFAVYFSEFNQIWGAHYQIGLSRKSCQCGCGGAFGQTDGHEVVNMRFSRLDKMA
jgi:hypothetical protein